MASEETVRICPRCGSIDVDSFSKISFLTGEMMNMHCNKCKYGPGIFPEIPISEIEYFQKELKKNTLEK